MDRNPPASKRRSCAQNTGHHRKVPAAPLKQRHSEQSVVADSLLQEVLAAAANRQLKSGNRATFVGPLVPRRERGHVLHAS